MNCSIYLSNWLDSLFSWCLVVLSSLYIQQFTLLLPVSSVYCFFCCTEVCLFFIISCRPICQFLFLFPQCVLLRKLLLMPRPWNILPVFSSSISKCQPFVLFMWIISFSHVERLSFSFLNPMFLIPLLGIICPQLSRLISTGTILGFVADYGSGYNIKRGIVTPQFFPLSSCSDFSVPFLFPYKL